MFSSEVERALDSLLGELRLKVGTRQAKLMISNLAQMRQPSRSYESERLVLHAIEQLRGTFLSIPAPMATLPLELCPALAAASTPKLGVLLRRIELGLPARGMEPHETQLISEHARALIPAYGDEPEFVLRVVYQNLLTYSRNLIFGEVYDRNNLRPVEALAEAWWSAQWQSAGQVAAPVAALPEQGVIIATGPELPESSADSWAPARMLFHGLYGERLWLDDVNALQRFLRLTRPPVSPRTLASLIHVLLAPFPWTAPITVENRLVERFEPRAVAIEGGQSEADEGAEEELILRVDGVTVLYRAGVLMLDE